MADYNYLTDPYQLGATRTPKNPLDDLSDEFSFQNVDDNPFKKFKGDITSLLAGGKLGFTDDSARFNQSTIDSVMSGGDISAARLLQIGMDPTTGRRLPGEPTALDPTVSTGVSPDLGETKVQRNKLNLEAARSILGSDEL